MNPDRQQARDYLRAPAHGLWRWAENNAVLVWKDGGTIAFREEIVAILEWLAPGGLPSFGAIVFLLAACRGKLPAPEDLSGPGPPAGPPGGVTGSALLAARRQLALQIGEALQQLARVPGLPAELITGLKAKGVLAETVFERARAERYANAGAVLRGLREAPGDLEWNSVEPDDARSAGIRHLHLIALGLKPHSVESLTWRLRTGLDAAPRPVECELPASERARRLIEELSEDAEEGAVARAARELLAAVRLPRRLGEREELACGGVADLSNRGPLDRLLLSELAHDDLTLAVRVALNEALYLRHEPPRREPPGALAVLLDSGVRLWGVPRVLGTAVALALTAREKPSSTILCWRARGNELMPLDLLSRTGLMLHLGSLEAEAHPGDALAPFLAALPAGTETQAVVITHRDTLRDPEFRRCLSGLALGFIAAVDREGRFELHALPLSQRRPICQANLDLGAVFPARPGKSRPAAVDPDLPAIFGVKPFPFLLPIAGKIDFWVTRGDGAIYAILNDRRLVSFRDRHRGGRVLAPELPGGRTIAMTRVGDVLHLIKGCSRLRPARLVSFPLPDGPVRKIDLEGVVDLLSLHLYGDVILVIRSHDVRAYALSDGRALGKAINPYRWIHGRYFRGENQFHYVTWDGAAVRFEPVSLPKDLPSPVLAIFDREGVEGPWLILEHGTIVSSATGETVPTGVPARKLSAPFLIQVSRDGHRAHLSIPSLHWRRLIDFSTKQIREVPASFLRHGGLDENVVLPGWNVYRVVEGLTRPPGALGLVGRRSRSRRLYCDAQERIRIGDLPPHAIVAGPEIHFPAEAKPTGYGCSLRMGAWPSGTQAFLDSRGLLHLKSHDRSLPEVSLILSDGEVAGWTSDGHVCGPAFFFEGSFVSRPQEVFARVLRILSAA